MRDKGFVGKPCRTEHGELSLRLTELPQLLSPCLHDVPLDAKEHENSPYDRHVQLLADSTTRDILLARGRIIEEVRRELQDGSFVEVSTPILASVAGGAIAQPFLTSATEFPERPLAMRIAPELWLKRLIAGGFDRVFEIGPQFRNEGRSMGFRLSLDAADIVCSQASIKRTTPNSRHVNSI